MGNKCSGLAVADIFTFGIASAIGGGDCGEAGGSFTTSDLVSFDLIKYFGDSVVNLFNTMLGLFTGIGKFAVQTIDILLFAVREIMRMIPSLLDILVLIIKLIKKGLLMTKVLLFFAPFCIIIYGLVYIIQLLERRY